MVPPGSERTETATFEAAAYFATFASASEHTKYAHAAAANEVKEAAEQTAAHGAKLAEQAGFDARPLTVEAAPTWKGLVKVAKEHQCGLIVIGSHQRGGLLGHLAGSVASATVSHFENSVLVIHKPH